MVERALVIVTREHAGDLRHARLARDGLDAGVRQCVCKGLLAHHVMLVGKGRDLGQMRDDDDLGTLGKRGETPGDRVARGTADTGIDLVEDNGGTTAIMPGRSVVHAFEREQDARKLATARDTAQRSRLGRGRG